MNAGTTEQAKYRDELAARFMQAIVESNPGHEASRADDYARSAYRFADAFLAVRARGGK